MKVGLVHRAAWVALVAVFLCKSALCATPLPEAKPEDVGMSSARLERLGAAFKKAVEAGDMPGVVLMVARNGKLVYQQAIGMQDQAKSTPMALDSIFRIYSMTKPIVTVAAMTLVEEGRLSLDEPISKYLPEFKDMTVGIETFNAAMGTSSFYTVPAKRQITVQDLMRHTSGLTYGVFVPKTQFGRLYAEANLCSRKPSRISARHWPRSHCATSRARCGSTAIPPTCSAAWWKLRQASRWISSSTSAS